MTNTTTFVFHINYSLPGTILYIGIGGTFARRYSLVRQTEPKQDLAIHTPRHVLPQQLNVAA